MTKRPLYAGMHIVFVVSLPVTLVLLSQKSLSLTAGYGTATTHPVSEAAADTLTVSFNGNTIARAAIPFSSQPGTLTFHYADSTYTLPLQHP